MMQLGIRPGQTPPFHNLGEYVFQDLCRDLFEAQSGIATCEVYGTRGQSQFGIDLLANRVNAEGREVGQCKCYENFSGTKILQASDEFFKHWEHWSEKKIKRFILFVASDLTQRQCQDEIIKQQKRFAQVGITYEAWSAATIRNRLRLHSGIVTSYCKPEKYWVEEICGTLTSEFSSFGISEEQSTVVVNSALVNQLDQLSTHLTGQTKQDLDEMRRSWREGRRTDVIKWVKSLRNNGVLWPIISSKEKARVLCFEARLELDANNDINQAKQLADEARILDPSDNQARLRAVIAYHETGPETAIPYLNSEKDIDALNLKSALLLDTGKIDESRAILERLTPNAESFRLKALSHLIAREMPQARLEIQKALELEPRWESIRFAKAMINYFSTLSPVALPTHPVSWPEPISPTFIKRDDESLSRLREATRLFRELNDNTDEEKRIKLQIWILACISNDPDSQEEAIRYCQEILERTPDHYEAIAWANARSFHIDLKPSQKTLGKMVRDGRASIPHLIALVICYLESKSLKKALTLLKNTRGIFQEKDADHLWVTWKVQAFVADGRAQQAMRLIERSAPSESLKHLKSFVFRATGKKKSDPQGLIKHLETSYKETGDIHFLLEGCEFMAQQNKWGYVADRAEELVEKINTCDVLRLAVISTYNAKRFDFCLTLLENNRALFQHKKIPSDLRQIQSLCYRDLGFLREAISKAETLAQEEPTKAHLLSLAHLYYEKGDFLGLVVLSRKLYRHSDLTANDLFGLSNLIKLTDRSLAISFWEKALSQDLNDNLVGSMLNLGFQLGLDRKLEPLLSRIAGLSGKGEGGLRFGTISDVIALNKQKQEQLAKLSDAYQRGIVTIHAIVDTVGQPLVNSYHCNLEKNKASFHFLNQLPLLIRHGGRILQPDFPKKTPKWHLNMDVTAILLAEHLGVLSEVEQVFKPLRIQRNLIPSLIAMSGQIIPGQPSRLENHQNIISFVEQGRIKIVECEMPLKESNYQIVEQLGENWVSLYERASSEDGLIVEFFPLNKIDGSGSPVEIPSKIRRRLVNCRAIIEALYQNRSFSKSEYIEGLKQIGSEGGKSVSETIPDLGAKLYCNDIILGILTDTGNMDLLRTVSESFQVYIGKRELDRIRLELQEADDQQKTISWLTNLIARISNGIDNDLYELIPVSSKEANKSEDPLEDKINTRCLLELLQFEPRQNDVLWVDDRHINAYQRRDTIPIIGINEVLKALVGAKALEIGAYYKKISHLREANTRFIPVESDEILYRLRQVTRIKNGDIVETHELTVLRRYVADCLLRGNMLQKPPMADGSANMQGETAFIVGLSLAVTDSLVEIWRDSEANQAACVAHAHWVMQYLYTDTLGMLEVLSWQREEQEDHSLVSMSLVGLISKAMSLAPSRGDNGTSDRHRYFDWLYDQVLEKRLRADPNLTGVIAKILGSILPDTLKNTAEESSEPEESFLLREFYRDLPKPIKDALGLETTFSEKVGLKFRNVIRIEGLDFNHKDFLRAASVAINGRDTSIIPIDSDQPIAVSPLEESTDSFGFYLTIPPNNEKKIIEGDEVGILLESSSEREKVLRKNRNWFDCSDKLFNQAIAEIVTIGDSVQRMEKVISWQNSSAALYYERLEEKLRELDQLKPEDLLPPSCEGLLRHYRLDFKTRTNSFEEIFEVATKTLLQEEGLWTTINDFIGLPTHLPSLLVEKIGKLSPGQKRTFIKRLLEKYGSPISKIHFIRILLSFKNESIVYLKLAQRVLTGLLNDKGLEDVKAFLAVLNWVEGKFGQQYDEKILSPPIRLAMIWAHTHRLFTSFVYAGSSILSLQEYFGQRVSEYPSQLFARTPEYWFDLSHPRRVTRERFIVTGLSYGLGGEGKGKRFSMKDCKPFYGH